MTCRRLASSSFLSFALTAFFILAGSQAQAADIHWTNAAGGNWNTPGNWDSGVPGSGDNAIIDLAGTYTVTLDVNPTVTSFSLGAASGTQTLSASGRTITISAASTIGANGVLLLTTGTVSGTGTLDNHGTITSRVTTTINIGLTTTPGSLLRVEGAGGSSSLTVANGFTNNGTIEMTSSGAAYAATLNVTAGTLTNASGGSITVLPGNGGARTLGAQLDNQGTITVGATLTINKASADDLNSGTINVSGGNLTVTQSSATPSFTTTGTITIGATYTLTISGGAFDFNGGSISGAGSLALTNNVTWGLGADFTNTLGSISVSGGTVNGTGTLTNAGPLTLAGMTINTSLANQNLLVSHGATIAAGAFTTTTTSTLRVEGSVGASTLTFANGFTNNGTVEMTSVGAGYAATLNLTTGTLINETTGAINALPGVGGTRTIGAELDNRGSITVGTPLTVSKASADHLNSGTINVSGGDLTVAQSSTTPSLTTTGTITIGATYTLTISGGSLEFNAGSISGAGSLALSAVTWDLNTGFTNTLAGVSVSGGAVNGPGTLTNAAPLTLANTTVNCTLANQSTLVSHTATTIAAAFTTTPSSDLQVEGFAGASVLTFASGFTNNGTIEMTSSGAGYAATLNVTAGTLVNAATGTISVLPGVGGARTLGAELDNRGTLTISTPFTLNKGSADHLNSGTIDVSGADLTLTQSGTTPSFTSTGTINIGATRTLSVSNGEFDYNGGGITGTGSLSLTSATWNLGISFTNALTTVSLSLTTVNGPGILTNAAGKNLVLTGCTVNADLVNQGTLVSHTGTDINGTFTSATSSDLQVEGAGGASIMTFANGFTNNGTIEMTSFGAGYSSNLSVTNGTLVNEVGKTISVLPGVGGARTLAAQLDNRGTLTVSTPLAINKPSADHLNSGTIDVSGADLTLTQSGSTPSLTTTGTITIGATRTLTVNGGEFDYNAGSITGGGTLAFMNSATWNLGISFSNVPVELSMSATTVNGPGVLTNATGKTLVLGGCTINADLVNQGTLVGHNGTDINGTFTSVASSDLKVEGANGASILTFANGFTNNATIEITSFAIGYSSALNVTNGTLVNDVGKSISAEPGAGGARTLGAQLDNRGTLTVDAPLTINKSSADHLNSGTIDVSGADLTLSQSLTTPTFSSSGTITIGATRTFTASGGTFTNAPGGILEGNGTLDISGTTFTNTGDINPGTSPGILSITGSPMQSAPGAMNFELGGSTPGIDQDQLAVSGTANLGGAINATLVNGFTPTVGDSFVVMTTGTTAGLFDTQNLPPLGGGLEFQVGYRPSSVVLKVVNPAAVTLSIDDVSVTEGNSGTTDAVFTVSLSEASSQTITVDFATADNTATSPADYVAQSGTLTFSPSVTTQQITVPVQGDALNEPNETFFVNLSNATNATIADPQGIGTITDDDPVPTLSIDDVTVTEGDLGTVDAVFTVSLSAASGRDVLVHYSTVANTATSPADFVVNSGTLTFPAGTTNQSVTVAVNGDLLDEADETFFVNLNTPSNATIADAQGIGTITDDDPLPSLSIDDVTVTEGNSGPVLAAFTVTLSAPSGRAVSVNFGTADNTATAPDDYSTISGIVNFPAGTTTQTVNIAVNGDALDEPDEIYFVNLSSPTNATIGDGQGQGTITDDDPTPSLATADVMISEGGGSAVFTVVLSAVSGRTVTVDYNTADGSATAPGDYTASTGTLTFPPGTVSQTISVPIVNDSVVEGTETFLVNLANPGNATVSTPTATGTIVDDDSAASTLSIDDVIVAESGGTAVFTVSRSGGTTGTVTVDYAAADGTAAAPGDYTSQSGTLTFPPGTTTQTVAVTVTNDLLNEPSETFFVNLTNPSGATIADGQGVATIVDDDPVPSLSIGDVTVAEGNSGTVDAVFTATLSAASGQTVTVNWATADDTATDPADYAGGSGTLTFSPGATSQSVTVAVKGDLLDEPNETFFVNLSSPSNATIADNQGLGTITDDDSPPAISINDVSVTEGNSGTTDATFAVTLSTASGFTVTVDWGTQDDTATAPLDYGAGTGTLTFPPGVTTQPVTVTVQGDLVTEPDETFFVNLSSPSNATIADGQGVGTINNDDVLPSISINDVSVTEGNSGTTDATFAVTLSAAGNQTVTVDWATADNTATAPSDYASGSGTLTFPPGTTSRSLTVTVNGDVDDEPNETFFVNLSNPSNATIADAQGQGTIVNDERVILPEQREFWRHHLDVVALYLPISLGTVTVNTTDQANLVLKFGDGPDWNHKLRAELLATIVNIAYGASNADCIQQTVDDAQAFLDANGTKRLTRKSYHSLADEAQDLLLALRAYNDGHAPCFPGSATVLAQQTPETRVVSLGPNYPNPFNGLTTIEYSLPTSAPVRLVVYDVRGREVRELVARVQGPGAQWATWDGTNRAGTPVSSGVYYYRLTVKGSSQLGKMILAK
jgi:hypothetical protein